MGKVLKCRDIGVDCDFEAHGSDEAEILQKAAVHASASHQNVQVTPELQDKIKAAIKDEGGECCGGGSSGSSCS
jgi:predicted small metal-binding protein